jgi:hypothetical protein
VDKTQAKKFKSDADKNKFTRWIRMALNGVRETREYNVGAAANGWDSDSDDNLEDGNDVRADVSNRKVYTMTDWCGYNTFQKCAVGNRADNSRGPGGPMGPLCTPLKTPGALSRPSITHSNLFWDPLTLDPTTFG